MEQIITFFALLKHFFDLSPKTLKSKETILLRAHAQAGCFYTFSQNFCHLKEH